MADTTKQHQSASDIHQDDDNDQEGFLQRHRITAPKILKTIFLITLVTILILLVTVMVNDFILNAKKMYKITGNPWMEELSGLDEEAYRSFYYYKEMEKMARDNVNNGMEYDPFTNTHLKDISFKELFGAFKVVKAIQYANKFQAIPVQKDQQQNIDFGDPEALDKAYNYTEYFGPAANQYSCGSCYSFPIAATIEYVYRKHFNITVKLSEQQLIDCSSGDETVDGCTSGNITKGFEYAMNVGLVQQEDYPYRSKNGHSFPCRTEVVEDDKIPKFKISSFRFLPKGKCQAIQFELSKGNTVASMISDGELPLYTEATTTPFRNCPKEPFNHAITIVGQTDKQDWIIRNSWGTSWGKNGYLIMRGDNTCGVCLNTIVPELSDDAINPLAP